MSNCILVESVQHIKIYTIKQSIKKIYNYDVQRRIRNLILYII
jgi:hypothetical protein